LKAPVIVAPSSKVPSNVQVVSAWAATGVAAAPTRAAAAQAAATIPFDLKIPIAP